MWFCIGMYFFLGACAWMYFKKKSLFRKWDRLLRQIFFLMLAVTSLAFLSEIVQCKRKRAAEPYVGNRAEDRDGKL